MPLDMEREAAKLAADMPLSRAALLIALADDPATMAPGEPAPFVDPVELRAARLVWDWQETGATRH